MADQNITALPVSTTPESSDQLLLVGATEEKLIDYDKLADAILNKLTSKNFSLDQGTMPLISALNQLNSNVFIDIRNLSTFSVNIELNTYTYASFLAYGAKYNGFMYIVFVDVASEKRTVNFIKIADFVAKRTFSGTYSDDTSTLTISASETIWGGIKMLMLK